MNLIDKVQAAMLTDSECPERNSERIAEQYRSAPQAEKEALDTAFIALCGHSLETMLKPGFAP